MTHEKPVQYAINKLIKQIFTDERKSVVEYEKILTDVGLAKIASEQTIGYSWSISKPSISKPMYSMKKSGESAQVQSPSPRSRVSRKLGSQYSTSRIGFSADSTMRSHLKLFLSLLAPLVAWSIVGGVMQIGEVKNSQVKLNLISVYANTIRWWNTMACAQNTLFSMLMWQRTKPVLGQDATTSLEQLLSALQNQAIPIYKDLLGQDLGNYTEVYQKMMNGDFNMTTVNQVTNSTFFHSEIGTGPSEYMNFNILTTIKYEITIIERIYAEWKLTEGDIASSRNIFKSPGYKTFFFYSTYLDALNFGNDGNIYYSVILPLVPGIPLIASQSALSSQLGTTLPITALVFLLVWMIFLVPLFKRPRLESRLASQMRRKTTYLSGAVML